MQFEAVSVFRLFFSFAGRLPRPHCTTVEVFSVVQPARKIHVLRLHALFVQSCAVQLVLSGWLVADPATQFGVHSDARRRRREQVRMRQRRAVSGGGYPEIWIHLNVLHFFSQFFCRVVPLKFSRNVVCAISSRFSSLYIDCFQALARSKHAPFNSPFHGSLRHPYKTRAS